MSRKRIVAHAGDVARTIAEVGMVEVTSADGHTWWTLPGTIEWTFREGQELAQVGMVAPDSLVDASDRDGRLTRAIGEKIRHPDWTDKQVAEVCGISQSALCRCADYTRIRDICCRGDAPARGRRLDDGRLEAESDE